jgi:uncharacterized protein YggE
MHFAKILTALALVMPGAALAQGKATQPVSLELVSTGEIDAAASKLTLAINFTTHGKTQAAADKAKLAKYAEILALLQKEGIAASAVTDLSEAEMSKVMLSAATATSTVTEEAEDASENDPGKDAAAAEATPDDYSATDGKSVVATSLMQAKAVKSALEKIDVTVGEPEAELDEAGTIAARRQAKAKALRDARADAEAYAREMNMRVQRVARISEVGNNLILPGLQTKFQDAMAKGPAALMGLFTSKPGTIHIESSIVVEFVLVP